MKNDSKYNWSVIIYVFIIQILTLDLQNISDWSVGERLTFLIFVGIFALFGVPYYNMMLKFMEETNFSFKNYIKTFIWTNIIFLILYQFVTFNLDNIMNWSTKDRASFLVAYIVMQIFVFIWYDVRMINKKNLEKEEI